MKSNSSMINTKKPYRAKPEMGLDAFKLQVFSEYEFADGVIKESGSITKTYSYFDFYHGQDDLIGEGSVKQEDLASIFGKQMTQDEKIFVSFAALDETNEEQILAWIKLFGLPCKHHKIPLKSLGNEFNRLLVGSEKISTIKDEIALMKWLLAMFSLYKTKEWVDFDIDKSTGRLFRRKGIFNPKNDQLWKVKSERIGLINQTIESLFSRQLRYVHPELSYELGNNAESQIMQNLNIEWDIKKSFNEESCSMDTELHYNENSDLIAQAIQKPFICDYPAFFLKWSFPSLLSAMYFHMALDINKSVIPISCANNRCRKYFSPIKSSQRFCSPTCRNRDNQQKRWRSLKEK